MASTDTAFGSGDNPQVEDRGFRGGLSAGQAWYAVAILTLANVSGAIDRQIFASLAEPVKRDLGLSDTQVSLLSGCGFAVLFSVFGLAIGRLVDRRRRTHIVAVGAALWSFLTAITGITRNYGQLLLARVGVGVGEATLGPSAVSIIADAFPRGRLGTAMSVYMLGTFFGSGVSYALGAWIVSAIDAPGFVSMPIVGAIHPWQTVFFIIGLPGLLVALLMLTVREPTRAAGARATEQVPMSQVIAYLRRNARTMISLCVGFTCSASVNWGIGMWLQAFFVRTHGWSVAQAGALQGALTMGIGPVGTLLGGWMVDRYARRGIADAPLRVGMLGAAGMMVFAGLYPIVPSASLAAALLVPVNLFAALPWGAANAAIAEAMPSRMRGQGSAIFQLMVGLAGGIGPTAVALVTDRVYHNDASLRWSLALCTVVGMSLTLAILAWGRPAYRATVARRDESRERAIANAQ
ncbi:MAG: MFS transporter [Gemmatimonadaceae bacterium]|nr:MFS transporter [Gemmatimonadaceae bacterium]